MNGKTTFEAGCRRWLPAVVAAAATAGGAAGQVVAADDPSRGSRADGAELAAPTISLAAESDSGGSRTDRVTSDATPVLIGRAGKRERLEIRDGTRVIGTVVAGRGGAWRFVAKRLKDGEHTLLAMTVGNRRSSSRPLRVTIDTRRPAAPTMALAAGSDTGTSRTDGITADTTPTIAGRGEKSTTVRVKSGSRALGSAKVAPNGRWTLTAPTLPAGTHRLSAVATDAAGNASPVGQMAIVVVPALIRPTTIALAPTSDTGTRGDGLTADRDPTFVGMAEPGATVSVSSGGAALVQAIVGASGQWTATVPLRREGRHLFTAAARDRAGNAGRPAAVAVDIDATPPAAPTLALLGASDTGVVGDGITADATPSFGGLAEAGARLALYDADSGGKLAVLSATDRGWSATTSTLADGTYRLFARATDRAGNTGPASPILVVTIDVATPGAPTMTLAESSDTGASSSDAVTADATPVLVGTASAGAEVTVRDGPSGDAPIIASVAADGDGAWSAEPLPLGDGRHVLTARARDAAGNLGAASTLGLVIDTAAPAAPTIALAAASDTGWSSSDRITSDTTPTIGGAAEAGATVTVRTGPGLDAPVVATGQAAGGAWSATATLVDGTYELAARAVDIAGNASATTTLAVTIDTIPPTAPTIDLHPDSDTSRSDDDVTRDTTPTFTGNAEAGTRVFLSEGATIRGTTTATGGSWSITSGDLGTGDRVFTTHASDAAGNEGPASAGMTVRVEAIPPFLMLSGFSAEQGARFDGAAADDLAGYSVSSAGDANGDGWLDLIIAAPRADIAGRSNSGAAYFVFGSEDGFPAVTSFTTAPANVVTLYGAPGSLINPVAGIGDVNGDGFDDIAAGSWSTLYIVFGSDGLPGTIDLTSLDGTNGVRLSTSGGEATASAAGDVNGDGRDDVVIGSPYASPGGRQRAGSTAVLFGRSTFAADIDLATLSAPDGLRLDGEAAEDHLGVSVSGGGDVNGDGIADILIGASGVDPDGRIAAGSVFVLFGVNGAMPSMAGPSELDGTTGFRIDGHAAAQELGVGATLIGDTNGDGRDDLAFKTGRELGVVFGAESTPSSIVFPLEVDPRIGFRAYAEETSIRALAGGDMDGDGLTDIVIAGRLLNGFGAAHVLYGRDATRPSRVDLYLAMSQDTFMVHGAASHDGAGTAAAILDDIDGDSRGDLLLGAPEAKPQGVDRMGSTYLVYAP